MRSCLTRVSSGEELIHSGFCSARGGFFRASSGEEGFLFSRGIRVKSGITRVCSGEE